MAFYITASHAGNGVIIPGDGVWELYSGFVFNCKPGMGFEVSAIILDGSYVDLSTVVDLPAYAGIYDIGKSYTVPNILANHTIHVIFQTKSSFIISASAGPNGAISPSGSMAVIRGFGEGFIIAPAMNYRIADVLVDGVSVGAVSSYTFGNVQANHTIYASFVFTLVSINAAVSGLNGTINPSGNIGVTIGQQQTFSFYPNIGYQVDTVQVVDARIDPLTVIYRSITSYTFYNIQFNGTIIVSFKQFDSYLINASAGANGLISPSGSTTVVKGTNKTFIINTVYHYHIQDVLVDGVSVGAVSSYTFYNVQATHTIEAIFELNSYSITSTAGPHGSVIPSGEISVNYGSTQSFTIVPDENYIIQDVFVDGVIVEIPASGVLFID